MQNNTLNIRNVLELIFKTTKKKGNILADCYLIKNSSIISKWKNSKSKPSIEDLDKIVEFAYKESSDMQRKIIRNEIECLIINSSLKESMKNSLLKISSFKEFLSEALNVATSGNDGIQDSSNMLHNNDSVIESDKSYNTKELDAIKVFSGDKEGNYTGEVEFNLTLSNDRGEKSNIILRGIGSFSMGIMNGSVKKKVGYASALGVIVVLIFAGLYSFSAGSKSQAMDKKSVVSNENEVEQRKIEPEVIEPERKTEEVILPEIDTKVNREADNNPIEIEKKVEEPIKTKHQAVSEAVTEEKKDNRVPDKDASEADEKDSVNSTEKENAKTDIENTENSIVIDNSPFVGNENVIGLGNNIYINIEN